MAKVKLTARGVAALETDKKQETVWDELLPGFGVRVSGSTGRKTYIVRYRANGKHRRLTLGRHPTLSLADARDKAREAMADAQEGKDPSLAQKQRRSSDVTFEALAREVLDAKAERTREATREERERILEKDLLPAWGDMPVSSVTRRDILHLLEGIVARGAPTMANRTLRLVQLIFNEGLRRGFPTLEANPASMMEPPGEEGRRTRYLDRAEIKAVWEALGEENPWTGAIFKLTLLTAQRIGSVCALRWDDVDEADVWRIPAAQFKGRRPHLVPLSGEAMDVLEPLRATASGEYVFPGRGDGSKPHITSTNKALQRIRRRTTKKGVEHWTAHDFRRTFRTWATRPQEPDHPQDAKGLGVDPQVADAVLGHKEASLGFERYTGEPERYRLAEKREALRRWGAFVDETVTM